MKKQLGRLLKRIVVLLVGVPIVILGVILIPLPGPGIVITLFGLFILGLEFDFARKRAIEAKDKINQIIEKSIAEYKRKMDEIDRK